MRTGITAKVVMLTTKKANGVIASYKDGSDLIKVGRNYPPNTDFKPQHLHAISNDNIKKGEWCISIFSEVVQAGEDYEYGKCNLRKIVASTDKEIMPNSWIPESFTLAYIKAHKEGQPITEIDLETTISLYKGNGTYGTDIINTRHDGSVIINRSKSFSAQDINKAIKEAIMHPHKFMTGICHDDKKSFDWITVNL